MHGAVGSVRAARLHALLTGRGDLELGASGRVEHDVGAAEEGTLGGTFDFAGVAAGGLFSGEVLDGGALVDMGGLLHLHDDAEDDVQEEVEV